jgi:phosphoribosylformylglycinamidine synthase
MLALVAPAALDPVLEVCRRWGVSATVIGKMVPGGQLRVHFRGELVADVPARSLADDGPVYRRPLTDPPARPAGAEVPLDGDPAAAVLAVASDPTCASKRWVYEQYDRFVGHGTVAGPGSDAALVLVPGGSRALALSVDGSGRYAALDPAAGAALAVAEAARNVACTGARPLAVTNCLNFASPERPEVMGAFAAAVRGMAAACRALGTPITGGNVSFYNQSNGQAIHPTPVIGVLGVLDDAARAVPAGFPREGLEVWLLGSTRADFGGSAWQRIATGRLEGRPPALDLEAEAALHRLLVELARAGLAAGAHDLSEGGLAIGLVEAVLAAGVGARVALPGDVEPLAALLSESPSRALVAVEPALAGEVETLAARAGVPAGRLGGTGGDRLVVEGVLDLGLDVLGERYEGAIHRALGEDA